MERDMHYYGTYAMAVAAGIPQKDANVIAYASQFTDDACENGVVSSKDGTSIREVSTAHNKFQSVNDLLNSDIEGQRNTWVPFHFLPGGKGKTFDEKILCVKNSDIAKEMFNHYINEIFEHRIKLSCSADYNDNKDEYGLELLGICAHVYMDTYSHYGFSGMCSEKNNVPHDTIKSTNKIFFDVIKKALKELITEQNGIISSIVDRFKEWLGLAQEVQKQITEISEGMLGHASVGVLPDLPYLDWEFEFENQREDGRESKRNNQESFLEACKNLHGYFAQVAQKCYGVQNVRSFREIEDTVKEMLISPYYISKKRENKWLNSKLCPGIKPYKDVEPWKDAFKNPKRSEKAISTNFYRFHNAAAYHRDYVLNELLPDEIKECLPNTD